MYQYFGDCGVKKQSFKCCSVALCEIQFKVPVCAERWLTTGYSHMCTYKVSEIYPQWWMEMIGVRHLEKLVRFF